MTFVRPCWLAWLPIMGMIGCDIAPPTVPNAATPATLADGPPTQPGRSPADKPDVLRLTYDPSAGTLTLYELNDRGGRWLLVTPEHPTGTPVSGKVAVPDDSDRVSVFYTVPGRRPSPRVTLREIADAQVLHASR